VNLRRKSFAGHFTVLLFAFAVFMWGDSNEVRFGGKIEHLGGIVKCECGREKRD
jgi:hypothetical protein